jgi:hypothetical protein
MPPPGEAEAERIALGDTFRQGSLPGDLTSE